MDGSWESLPDDWKCPLCSADKSAFREKAEPVRPKAEPVREASTQKLPEFIENDLSVGYLYGNAVSAEKPDRGALRCQVWSEKVSRMLQSLLKRYESEGNKMLENTRQPRHTQ